MDAGPQACLARREGLGGRSRRERWACVPSAPVHSLRDEAGLRKTPSRLRRRAVRKLPSAARARVRASRGRGPPSSSLPLAISSGELLWPQSHPAPGFWRYGVLGSGHLLPALRLLWDKVLVGVPRVGAGLSVGCSPPPPPPRHRV